MLKSPLLQLTPLTLCGHNFHNFMGNKFPIILRNACPYKKLGVANYRGDFSAFHIGTYFVEDEMLVLTGTIHFSLHPVIDIRLTYNLAFNYHLTVYAVRLRYNVNTI